MKKIVIFLLFIVEIINAQLSVNYEGDFILLETIPYNESVYFLTKPSWGSDKYFDLFEIDVDKNAKKHSIDLKTLAKDFSQFHFKYYIIDKYIIFQFNLVGYTRVTKLCRAFCYNLVTNELSTIDIEAKNTGSNNILNISLDKNSEEIIVIVQRDRELNAMTDDKTCELDVVKYNPTTKENEIQAIEFNKEFRINYAYYLENNKLFLSMYSLKTKNFWALYDISSQEFLPIEFNLKNKYFSKSEVYSYNGNWYFQIETGSEYNITDKEIFKINTENVENEAIVESDNLYSFLEKFSQTKSIYEIYFKRSDGYLTTYISKSGEINTTKVEIAPLIYLSKYYFKDNYLSIYSDASSSVGGKVQIIKIDLDSKKIINQQLLKSKLKLSKEYINYIDLKGNIVSLFYDVDKKNKQIVFDYSNPEF